MANNQDSIIMKNKDLINIMEQGENEQIEFKASFGKEAIETIVAFANTLGGKIIVGINDLGVPIGLELSPETIQKWLNQIKHSTSPAVIPDIENSKINGNNIAVITVNEYPVKPVSFKGKYYKRIKNSNHQMMPSEISDMYLQGLNLSWDAYEYPNACI